MRVEIELVTMILIVIYRRWLGISEETASS
jgi:hypothetical protein